MRILSLFILLFYLAPQLAFTQNYNKTKTIHLNVPLKDFSGKTKVVTVLDLRPKEDIGEITYRGKYYKFQFPTGNAKNDIENWFKKQNRNKGNQEILLLLQNFSISNSGRNNTTYCNLDIKFSCFLKTEGGYQFLTHFDDLLGLDMKNVPGLPSLFQENISLILQKKLSEAFIAQPNNTIITEDRLEDYESILTQQLPGYTNEKLLDGVYLDYFSFFQQKPESGFQMLKTDGEYTKAYNPITDKQIPSKKIYAIVEDSKAYKNTAIGFEELNRDERGYYLVANREILSPEEFKISIWFFIGGGFVGGAIGGAIKAIELDTKKEQAENYEQFKVYIDPLVGGYNFDH